jgi:hypothetical protein
VPSSREARIGTSEGRFLINALLAIAIVAVAVAAAVGLMLLVRRWAPVGGFFADSDRAAGVFAVAGTSFAVLLAFVIFLSFESYDRAREAASVEAVASSQMFRTAALFAPAGRRKVRGELVCYARAVVNDEWKTMRDGHESPRVDAWLARLEGTIDALPLHGDKQHIAYEHWFDQAAERREGRRGRLAEATPFVPSLVWLALLLGGCLVIGYMCFYADAGEHPLVQAMMMTTIAAIVVAGVLVVRFLDRPYHSGSGSIKPVAMTTTLTQMEGAASVANLCGASGVSRASRATLERSAPHG